MDTKFEADHDAITTTFQPTGSDPATDLEHARQELFRLNGISDEQVAAWKSQWADIGWTTFLIPGSPHAVVFVYRALTRKEWKQQLRPLLQKVTDQDQAKELFCSQLLLFPVAGQDPAYWENMPAFIPDTLETILMNVSGSDTQTIPMKL